MEYTDQSERISRSDSSDQPDDLDCRGNGYRHDTSDEGSAGGEAKQSTCRIARRALTHGGCTSPVEKPQKALVLWL